MLLNQIQSVETFDISENVQNLQKLGFYSRITFAGEFDPNDKDSPKTPMEFLVYPVDEISTIYKAYKDDRYQRFIDEAKRIFKKYENECNPDNKFLYKETENVIQKLIFLKRMEDIFAEKMENGMSINV